MNNTINSTHTEVCPHVHGSATARGAVCVHIKCELSLLIRTVTWRGYTGVGWLTVSTPNDPPVSRPPPPARTEMLWVFSVWWDFSSSTDDCDGFEAGLNGLKWLRHDPGFLHSSSSSSFLRHRLLSKHQLSPSIQLTPQVSPSSSLFSSAQNPLGLPCWLLNTCLWLLWSTLGAAKPKHT